MRVLRAELTTLKLPLSVPYRIAYDEFSEVECVFLRLVTEGRHIGIGCAAPDPHVTGETAATILSVLKSISEDHLVGRDPLRPARILSGLAEPLAASPGAMAAVDMALYDLLGRSADLPVWRLLGGFRRRIATSITLGILSPDETVRRARDYVLQGFQALKLKGGTSITEDIERLSLVREEVGDGIALRFDANQGFDVAQSRMFIEAVRHLDLEVIEQPVPKGDLRKLGDIVRSAPQPIMADESLLTLRDAFRLGRDELVDMLNIKLMKAGGIAAAMRVDAVARAARMETMVGCMDEPAVGISAGLAVALASPNVALADLDGHLDLAEDPTRGAVRLEDGYLYPSDAPGLGVPDSVLD